MRAYLLLSLLAAATPGCFVDNHPGDTSFGDPACATPHALPVDTGASVVHEAGVDPGYYVEYDGSGAWHLEWTCDTKLSAEGCEFSGTINAPTPAEGVNATCYHCEPDDFLQTSARGSTTDIDFDTITSTGIDGVDFTTPPGATITVDLQINQIDQDDLVFVPSDGATTTPACMPLDLIPTAP